MSENYKTYNQGQMQLFPARIDENIPENDPVRLVNAIVDGFDLSKVHKLYKSEGCRAYHPRMMLKILIYAYLNNIYSCRKIENSVLFDVRFMWLAGGAHPDFDTINRFRNRIKEELNDLFTQLVLYLSEQGFITLDVVYVDGTKIESKSNRYRFVWKKAVKTKRTKLLEVCSINSQIRV